MGAHHKLPTQSLKLSFDRREHQVHHPIGHVHPGARRPFLDARLVFRADADLKLLVLAHPNTIAAPSDCVNTSY